MAQDHQPLLNVLFGALLDLFEHSQPFQNPILRWLGLHLYGVYTHLQVDGQPPVSEWVLIYGNWLLLPVDCINPVSCLLFYAGFLLWSWNQPVVQKSQELDSLLVGPLLILRSKHRALISWTVHEFRFHPEFCCSGQKRSITGQWPPLAWILQQGTHILSLLFLGTRWGWHWVLL